MSDKIICFASAKGGTGKTIVSASLASLLAALDKKVLLIDMDAATNGLSLFYLAELIKSKEAFIAKKIVVRGIFESRTNDLPIPFEISPKIDLIPAVYEMKQTDCIFKENDLREIIIDTLQLYYEKYDFIIFDTQSGTDIYAKIAIENSDKIVIVSEYDPISSEGVERFKRLFSDVLPPEKTWILFNKILPEFSKSLGTFLGIARYLSPIPWDADVVRALVFRKLAIDTEKGNLYTFAIMQMTSTLLSKEIGSDLDMWKKDKEKILKKPIYDQLTDIENCIMATEKAIIDTEFQIRSQKNRPKLFVQESLSIILAIATLIPIIYLFIDESSNIYTKIIINFANYVISMPFTLIGMAISLSVISISLFSIFLIDPKSKTKEKTLREQEKILERKLDDLNEKRRKFITLADANIEDVFGKL